MKILLLGLLLIQTLLSRKKMWINKLLHMVYVLFQFLSQISSCYRLNVRGIRTSMVAWSQREQFIASIVFNITLDSTHFKYCPKSLLRIQSEGGKYSHITRQTSVTIHQIMISNCFNSGLGSHQLENWALRTSEGSSTLHIFSGKLHLTFNLKPKTP